MKLETALLFDWHFSPQGRQLSAQDIHPLFIPQLKITSALAAYFNLSYQFKQFLIFHALHDLKNKTVLEVGGSLPSEVVFQLFGVREYIDNESPEYVEAWNGEYITGGEGADFKRRSLTVKAEDLDNFLPGESVDFIFSVACFEHVYDLTRALRACHSIIKPNGILYSFFAPIYSFLTDGHHGVIPTNHENCEIVGLHLLKPIDQRNALVAKGLTDPKELQDFLGSVNFNRIPNRLRFEEYSQILTESPFYVLRLDEVAADYNISKRFPTECRAVRDSDPALGNIHTQGFRVVLTKL